MKIGGDYGRLLEGQLRVHAELDYVEERLQHGLRLIVASRSIPRHQGFVVFEYKRRIDGVARPLLPGASTLAIFSSRLKYCKRLLRTNPPPSTTTPLPKVPLTLCVTETRFPNLSAMAKEEVSPGVP